MRCIQLIAASLAVLVGGCGQSTPTPPAAVAVAAPVAAQPAGLPEMSDATWLDAARLIEVGEQGQHLTPLPTLRVLFPREPKPAWTTSNSWKFRLQDAKGNNSELLEAKPAGIVYGKNSLTDDAGGPPQTVADLVKPFYNGSQFLQVYEVASGAGDRFAPRCGSAVSHVIAIFGSSGSSPNEAFLFFKGRPDADGGAATYCGVRRYDADPSYMPAEVREQMKKQAETAPTDSSVMTQEAPASTPTP